MKCDSCKFLWYMSPDYTTPYGEYACMKLEVDLYGEEVTECEHYVTMHQISSTNTEEE